MCSLLSSLSSRNAYRSTRAYQAKGGYGDFCFYGTLGMHRVCIKLELPTFEGMTFFNTLRAQAQRVPHKADS